MSTFRIAFSFIIFVSILAQAHPVFPQASSTTYTLVRTLQGQEIIQSGEGESFPVVTWDMRGNIGSVAVKDNVAIFYGWGADVKNAVFPDAVLVFVNGKFFYSGQTSTDQKWLVEKTGNPALLKAGFAYKIPLEEFEDFDNSEIRFFGFWKNGGARELNYYEHLPNEQYPWKKKNNPGTHKPEVREEGLSPYSLISISERGEIIRTHEGKPFPILVNTMTARLGLPQIKRNMVEFQGWAADLESGESPKAILVFVNDKFFHAGKTGHMTPWLLERYENPALAEAGFYFTFPLQNFNNLENSDIRVFSLWNNGVALEMSYHKDYQWQKKQGVSGKGA